MLKELSKGEKSPSATLAPSRSSSREDLPTYSVDLPSYGVFYPKGIKSVSVSAFTVGQVRALKAIDETSYEAARQKVLVETIGKSIHNFDVMDLTHGDFVFLMYWLRLNSYRKSPFQLKYTSPIDGVKRETVVSSTNLKVIELDRARPINPKYGYITVREQIQLLEESEPGLKYVMKHAAFLNLPTMNLMAKCEHLESMHVDTIPEIEQHITSTLHGVSEHVVVREGDVEVNVPLKMDIANFFP